MNEKVSAVIWWWHCRFEAGGRRYVGSAESASASNSLDRRYDAVLNQPNHAQWPSEPQPQTASAEVHAVSIRFRVRIRGQHVRHDLSGAGRMGICGPFGAA